LRAQRVFLVPFVSPSCFLILTSSFLLFLLSSELHAVPGRLAREKIDKLLTDCGWIIQKCSTIVPIETFDFIITDERDRSIYNLWRQVLEYFGAYLVGLTATPSKRSIDFFNKNLVMEYGHERVVVDNVNVHKISILDKLITVVVGIFCSCSRLSKQ